MAEDLGLNEIYELSSDVKLIYKILREDLDEMCNNLSVASFPILALVCSGIDFTGGLKEGFGKKSRDRFVNFIDKYMYPEKRKLAHFIYTFIRNKIAHSAFIYGKFETEKNLSRKHWHLRHKIEYHTYEFTETSLNTIYINPDRFKEDFISALDKFDEDYLDGFIYENTILLNFKKEKDKMKGEAVNMIEESDLDTIEVDREEHSFPRGTGQETFYILKERKGIDIWPRDFDKTTPNLDPDDPFI